MNDTVIHGDALSVLRGMADNSVDAICTDPPAGINFMNKPFDDDRGGRDQWVAWLKEIMIEAKRVIKPGGHALIWALPRTSHWTATALEDAGWEIRDCVYSIFGSGFPKSLDIGKAIDKHLGKKREIVGMANGTGMSSLGVMHDDEWKPQGANLPITAPATPEAAQWQGWGSALKPAVECWWLCRKPLAESSIAAQVLATGTGGLNIDATRIGLNGDDTSRSLTPAKGWKNTSKLNGSVNDEWKKGRFPSHLLLSHSLWCVPRGTKRVRGTAPRGKPSHGEPMSHSEGWGYKVNGSGIHYNDSEGYEHVEAYDCAPDCPIAELDRQSGVRKSTGGFKAGSTGAFGKSGIYSSANGEKSDRTMTGYGDSGTVSRYFQNFPPDDYTPFLYQSKASRAERNRGCEDLPSAINNVDFGTMQAGGSGKPVNGNGQSAPRANTHPTVKSTSLMRWLIRLITPPDGIVLDPFCGSGSTCVAAIAEGKHFIGIEQDASYVAIAQARIAHAIVSGKTNPARESIPVLSDSVPQEAARYFQQFAPDLWTQDMQDAEDVFIAEGGYEDEVPA